MRIVEDSDARLTLKDRTLWITAVCFCVAGIMIWQAALQEQHVNLYASPAFLVVFGLAFLHMTDVVLDKTRRVATLRRLTVIKLTRASLGFEDIVDVAVQREPLPESNSISCRLAFLTRDATIPLSASYQPDPQRYDAMRAAILRALSRVPDATAGGGPVRDQRTGR